MNPLNNTPQNGDAAVNSVKMKLFQQLFSARQLRIEKPSYQLPPGSSTLLEQITQEKCIALEPRISEFFDSELVHSVVRQYREAVQVQKLAKHYLSRTTESTPSQP